MMDLNNHYFILRHGETTWPHTEICYPLDNKESVALSENGISQIKLVAEGLKKENISLIFCSEYLRVRLTAGIVSQALGLEPIIDARLNDTNIGIYYGGPKELPHSKMSIQDRFVMAFEKGESWNDVRARQLSFLNEIEEKYSGQTILVVGHGDSLWLLEGLINESSDQDLLDKIFKTKEYIRKGELRKVN